ncbi:MAG: DUF3842 family protein [Clostridia bacterium]|nr:DUF3842 family protein [Clostridia bacterium]
MKKVLLIDGQGGRIGQMLAEEILRQNLPVELIGVGTNATSTSAMLKGGVKAAATGENPVLVVSKDADFILGPIGILSADSLLGEITPSMAVAVGQSRATKILLPVSQCDNIVVGVKTASLSDQVRQAVEKLSELL